MTVSDPVRLDVVNSKPLAEMEYAIDALKARGVTFAQEQDDLDEYEIAYLSVGQGKDFAVMRYQNGPRDKATLLVSHEFFHQGDNAALVRTVADALGVPASAFRWRSERGEISAAA